MKVGLIFLLPLIDLFPKVLILFKLLFELLGLFFKLAFGYHCLLPDIMIIYFIPTFIK